MRIDKKKIYRVDRYSFKNFVLLDRKEREMVWCWRNDERVRRWMSHSEEIPLENHLCFVDSLLFRDDLYYWLVYRDLIPVGVVDVYRIDQENGSTEGGYYLSPEISDFGDGFEFHFYYKYFLFDILGFSMLKGPLLLTNLNSYALVTFCGGKAGEFMENGGKEYVTMETLKENFDVRKEDGNDMKKFVTHVRNCKVDWQNLLKRKK